MVTLPDGRGEVLVRGVYLLGDEPEVEVDFRGAGDRVWMPVGMSSDGEFEVRDV